MQLFVHLLFLFVTYKLLSFDYLLLLHYKHTYTSKNLQYNSIWHPWDWKDAGLSNILDSQMKPILA